MDSDKILVLVYFVCFCTFNISIAQSEECEICQTPENTIGECVVIQDCPKAYDLLANKPVSDDLLDYLGKLNCGFIGKLPKVCCAVDITTGSPTASNKNVTLSMRQFDDVKYRCGMQHPDDYPHDIIGTEALITEFPWLVRLRYKTADDDYEESFCSGALISPRHVLTAAHCQFNDYVLTTVRVGEYHLHSPDHCVNYTDINAKECGKQEDVKVKSFTPHPDYNGGSDGIHNIALIVLTRDVKYTDYVRPICLPHPKVTRPKVDEDLQVAGWGWRISQTTYDILQTKQRVNVKINSEATCNEGESKLQQSQLCGTRSTSDVCIYEDGGPLMFSYKYRWHLEGIALSHKRNCIGSTPPLVYVKVADYLDWIKKTVGTPKDFF